MEIHSSVPQVVRDFWDRSTPPHIPGDVISFHFHPLEEWLEVRTGEIRFFSAGERQFRLTPGTAFRIPPGEVHRVEIDAAGVEYDMWFPPVEIEEPLGQEIDPKLVAKNWRVPDVEDSRDAEDAASFFGDFLASDVVFRAVSGRVFLGRDEFLARPAPRNPIIRKADDAIRVLYKTPDRLLLSAVVHTWSADGGGQGTVNSVTNDRLFVPEEQDQEIVWRCRVWVNYPLSRSA